MKVTIRLFAGPRELVGAERVELDVPSGVTVEQAQQALLAQYEVLAPFRGFLHFAQGREYLGPGHVLGEACELACIPPVSGG